MCKCVYIYIYICVCVCDIYIYIIHAHTSELPRRLKRHNESICGGVDVSNADSVGFKFRRLRDVLERIPAQAVKFGLGTANVVANVWKLAAP